MRYDLMLSERFKREFRKLDRYTQRIIRSWMDKNLAGCVNPRATGKALSGNHAGRWRYRIGDYRLICEIMDSELVILALTVGHRKQVYNKK